MQSFLRSLFGADEASEGRAAGAAGLADDGRAVFGEHVVLGRSDVEILGERFARRDLRADRFRPVPAQVREELGGFA